MGASRSGLRARQNLPSHGVRLASIYRSGSVSLAIPHYQQWPVIVADIFAIGVALVISFLLSPVAYLGRIESAGSSLASTATLQASPMLITPMLIKPMRNVHDARKEPPLKFSLSLVNERFPKCTVGEPFVCSCSGQCLQM